jgi:hypothetical protein
MNNIKHIDLHVYMIYTSIHIDISYLNDTIQIALPIYIYSTDVYIHVDLYT